MGCTVKRFAITSPDMFDIVGRLRQVRPSNFLFVITSAKY